MTVSDLDRATARWSHAQDQLRRAQRRMERDPGPMSQKFVEAAQRSFDKAAEHRRRVREALQS